MIYSEQKRWARASWLTVFLFVLAFLLLLCADYTSKAVIHIAECIGEGRAGKAIRTEK